MKTQKWIASILFLCLTLTACQADNQNPSSSTSPSQAPPSSSSSQSQSRDDNSSAPEEKPELSVTGTVKDATMNFVVLTGEDGKEYTFFTSEADKSGLKNGILLDMELTVFYTESNEYPDSFTATRLVDVDTAS